MSFRKPGFFADWSRHGLGAAFGKRMGGGVKIGGRTYNYDGLATKDYQEVAGLLQQALQERNIQSACYCFEGMLIQAPSQWVALQTLVPILNSLPQDISGPAARKLLTYVTSSATLGSTLVVYGQQYTYMAVLWMPWDHVLQLMRQAVAEGQTAVVRWCFESMLTQAGGDFWRCWGPAMEQLEGQQEAQAIAATKVLLSFVPDTERLKQQPHTMWGSYLIGKSYLDEATSYRGSNKTAFLEKRPLAMHFLKEAREKTEEARQAPATDPYRQAAVIAGVAALTAAAYETCFYMAYKGTRDVSMSSNE